MVPTGLLCTFILLSSVGSVLCEGQPIVTIGQGVLKGFYTQTKNNREIAAFTGIPYAKPPTGKHRFKEAVAPSPWQGVYNGTRTPSACLQYNHLLYKTSCAVMGSEDCLYLNVYTPNLPRGGVQKLLDVIVFIHGGAFMFASGDLYQPHILLDRDVILVTMNYRLGPLGFLSTEDLVVSGNNGLKDQVLSLQWVQRNIAAFGGDPNKVTITGLSAGSASVHYHLLSPLSRGLFKGAILVSGVTLNPWTVVENSKEKAMFIANELGCPSYDSSLMIKCLRDRPAEQIVALSKNFLKFLYNPYTPFGPVIEPPGPTAFISEQPIQILREGRAADVPLWFSFTADEGLYPGAEIVGNTENLNTLTANWDDLLPHLLDYNFTVPEDKRIQIGQVIKEHYKINLDTQEGKLNLVKMLGDRLFQEGISKAVKLHAAQYTSPVYLSKFSYKGKYTVATLFGSWSEGVSHADDILFVLSSPMHNTYETDSDKLMCHTMIDLFVSFAANGTLPESWTPVTQSLPKLSYVNIEGPEVLTSVAVESLGEETFWNSLGLNENIEPTVLHSEL